MKVEKIEQISIERVMWTNNQFFPITFVLICAIYEENL